MIVLGLSSKGMLTRLIEGNVAQEVVRGARVPVLLLPAEWMQPV
jgi:nucleotide-binding universal stress UspA family protein